MTELLTVGDVFISKMLFNPTWPRIFPFLAPYVVLAKQSRASCGSCSRGKAVKGVDLGAIKRAIAGLSSEGKELFKKTAGAKQVKVVYRDSSGTVKKVIF